MGWQTTRTRIPCIQRRRGQNFSLAIFQRSGQSSVQSQRVQFCWWVLYITSEGPEPEWGPVRHFWCSVWPEIDTESSLAMLRRKAVACVAYTRWESDREDLIVWGWVFWENWSPSLWDLIHWIPGMVTGTTQCPQLMPIETTPYLATHQLSIGYSFKGTTSCSPPYSQAPVIASLVLVNRC